MLRSFHSLTDRRDVVHNSGASVDLQGEYRLDCAGPVLAQAALDLGRAHGMVLSAASHAPCPLAM